MGQRMRVEVKAPQPQTAWTSTRGKLMGFDGKANKLVCSLEPCCVLRADLKATSQKC